jgi:hypothetical protein
MSCGLSCLTVPLGGIYIIDWELAASELLLRGCSLRSIRFYNQMKLMLAKEISDIGRRLEEPA